VNIWLPYAVCAILSFIFFLRSAKKSVKQNGYEPISVAIACFLAALAWPLAWIFIFAIGYLGDKS